MHTFIHGGPVCTHNKQIWQT